MTPRTRSIAFATLLIVGGTAPAQTGPANLGRPPDSVAIRKPNTEEAADTVEMARRFKVTVGLSQVALASSAALQLFDRVVLAWVA